MSCFEWRLASRALGVLGGIPFVIAFCIGDMMRNPLTYIGAAFMAAGVIIGIFKCRCPGCGRHVSDNTPLLAGHCPYCGEKLD